MSLRQEEEILQACIVRLVELCRLNSTYIILQISVDESTSFVFKQGASRGVPRPFSTPSKFRLKYP